VFSMNTRGTAQPERETKPHKAGKEADHKGV